MTDLSVPQRQSVLAIIFLGIRIIRSLGIVQLAIALFFVLRTAVDGRLVVLLPLLVVAFGVMSALAWWRYTFQLADDELVVNKGVIRRDRLSVPIERIQSVSIDQRLLHRLFGLVKVSVDTAGSSETEFTIDAVSRVVAEELQRRAVDATEPAPAPHGGSADPHTLPPPAVDRVVFTHTPQRLLLAAITNAPWAGLVVLGSLFALAEQSGRNLADDVERVDVGGFRWWWIPLGLALFAAISAILNLVGVLLRDWQLTLRVDAKRLRRTSGLLSRTSRSSGVTRVQVLSSSQNPLQRQAGLRTITLSTASESNLSLIGCDDGQFDAIRTITGLDSGTELSLDRRIDPASIWLRTRNTSVVSIAIAALGHLLLGWWSTIALVAIPFVWAVERRRVATTRWSLGDELASRQRIVATSTEQALLRKANTVRVSQTLFERRRSLAHVHVATAAGGITVGMIPVAEAHAVRDVVLHTAESDPRPWM